MTDDHLVNKCCAQRDQANSATVDQANYFRIIIYNYYFYYIILLIILIILIMSFIFIILIISLYVVTFI
jgi:hypothetical protein